MNRKYKYQQALIEPKEKMLVIPKLFHYSAVATMIDMRHKIWRIEAMMRTVESVVYGGKLRNTQTLIRYWNRMMRPKEILKTAKY